MPLRVVRGIGEQIERGLADGANPLRAVFFGATALWVVTSAATAIVMMVFALYVGMEHRSHVQDYERWRRNVTWDMKLLEQRARSMGMLHDDEMFISTIEAVPPQKEKDQ